MNGENSGPTRQRDLVQKAVRRRNSSGPSVKPCGGSRWGPKSKTEVALSKSHAKARLEHNVRTCDPWLRRGVLPGRSCVRRVWRRVRQTGPDRWSRSAPAPRRARGPRPSSRRCSWRTADSISAHAQRHAASRLTVSFSFPVHRHNVHTLALRSEIAVQIQLQAATCKPVYTQCENARSHLAGASVGGNGSHGIPAAAQDARFLSQLLTLRTDRHLI